MHSDYNKRPISDSEKFSFKCNLSPVQMGELGLIGWYLKIEKIKDMQNKMMGNMDSEQKNPKMKVK